MTEYVYYVPKLDIFYVTGHPDQVGVIFVSFDGVATIHEIICLGEK